jgi:cell division protein FtsN
MSKRRKRRRMAFINRMNEIIKDNPTLSLDKVKTRTAIEVKSALRHADKTAPHDREEHTKVFEDTLFGRNKTTTTTTTTPTTTTKTTTTTAQTTTDKPTTTTKTSATKTKAAPKPKPTTRAKKTTTGNTTTKKRTTTKRTKKAK